MKRTKKLLALVLALMLSLSCMAMPAMAAGDEEIMPRKPVYQCMQCHAGAVSTYQFTGSETKYRVCKSCSYAHPHEVTYRYTHESCDNCSYDQEIADPVEIKDVCKHQL